MSLTTFVAGQVLQAQQLNDSYAAVDWNENVIINGAMNVAQRGTSVTGITNTNYYTADRFATSITSLGTWTQTVENDGPTGSGFKKSLKTLCTTADTTPAAGDLILINQIFEGQNVQAFKKGTSAATTFNLSFWVKSTNTGTFIAELYDTDNTRSISKAYTIVAANTWEYKTLEFAADTVGALDNDNAASLAIQFWLGAGSTFTSGTLQTTWGTPVNANRAAGQVNVGAATNNYWQITGVQLQPSRTSQFLFEDISTTIAKCERYFEKSYALTQNPGTADQGGMRGMDVTGAANTNSFIIQRTGMRTNKRAVPTIVTYDSAGNSGKCMKFNSGAAGTDNTTVVNDSVGANSFRSYINNENAAGFIIHYTASAEL